MICDECEYVCIIVLLFFFFQAEDGIRDLVRSRGLGDVYKRQLKDFTLSIDDGEVVGIVGPSGGGKSTLVQLLLGLREPDSGSILADGRPISEMSRNEWARRITFVPQAAHLVAGTVADNIRLLRSDVTQEDIERAAALAHLSEDVEQFEERYDRAVGEQGGQLSGGQQQRLSLIPLSEPPSPY